MTTILAYRSSRPCPLQIILRLYNETQPQPYTTSLFSSAFHFWSVKGHNLNGDIRTDIEAVLDEVNKLVFLPRNSVSGGLQSL